jgi:hypothetical protein
MTVIDESRAESRHRLASRPRRELAVIEVPSALGPHPSGVQDASDALRKPVCIYCSGPPKSSASLPPAVALGCRRDQCPDNAATTGASVSAEFPPKTK